MKEDKVLYQLNKLNKLVGREFIKNYKDNKMALPTHTQMQIIDYIISHQHEEVLQKDLESVLNLRRATVSGVLQTMEKHGFIKRVTSSQDARVKKIIFNESTHEVFDINKSKFDELENVIKENISDEELNNFLKTLVKMQENIINYTKIK